jgi:hypothetical protein
MTKIEITDAMVQRAVKAGYRWQGPGGYIVGDDAAAHVRMVLDAALNPPPEPEIEVTKEMCVAGACAYNGFLMMNQPIKRDNLASIGGVTAAYRAMRALEPKPLAAHDAGTVFTSRGPAHMHRRSGDTSRDTYFHRRAGDPK